MLIVATSGASSHWSYAELPILKINITLYAVKINVMYLFTIPVILYLSVHLAVP
jgi:hypothetical protein